MKHDGVPFLPGEEADCSASPEGNITVPCPSLHSISSLAPVLKSCLKKRNVQTFLSDLRWANPEWQLGLLHAV